MERKTKKMERKTKQRQARNLIPRQKETLEKARDRKQGSSKKGTEAIQIIRKGMKKGI